MPFGSLEFNSCFTILFYEDIQALPGIPDVLMLSSPCSQTPVESPTSRLFDVFMLPAAYWTASASTPQDNEAPSHGSLTLPPTLKPHVAASAPRDWIMAGG